MFMAPYCSINLKLPAKRDPTGAPKLFDKQIFTEVISRTIRLAGMPLAIDALNNLAPSI